MYPFCTNRIENVNHLFLVLLWILESMVAFHELVWNKDVRQNLLIKLFCSGVFLLKIGSNKELLQLSYVFIFIIIIVYSKAQFFYYVYHWLNGIRSSAIKSLDFYKHTHIYIFNLLLFTLIFTFQYEKIHKNMFITKKLRRLLSTKHL